MNKLLSTLFTTVVALCLITTQAFAAPAKKINANIKTKRVPAGTVLPLKVLTPVSSAKVKMGDQLDLMVMGNVKVDDFVVIPDGSVVRGSIEEVSAPKMLYKGGMVRLYFDHIVSPTGKQVPFYAGICNSPNVTYDGALSSKTNYLSALKQTSSKTKEIVVEPTKWAWEKGEDLWNGSPKYIFAPITAVGCTIGAGVYFVGDSVVNVFRKGKDMSINQGETITVQLIKPIDMPVY